jgi:hypothetical protein
MEGVLPLLTDETAQVRVVMIDAVLRSLAVRSAHEIAWMTEEAAAFAEYAGDVAAAAGDADLSAQAELAARPAAGLHLEDVADAYCKAGRALSTALEVAVARALPELIARGEKLLARRTDTETEVLAGWSPTGR